MKKIKLVMMIIGITLFVMAGCSNGSKNEEQHIRVEKRVNEQYEGFKEIKNKKEVQIAREIVNHAKWENTIVNMIHSADYRFSFHYNDPNIVEEKNILYELWISPNKDKVELVINGEGKYIKLNDEQSSTLFLTLTGEPLTEQ